jgi:hypothetical protein
MSSSVTVIYSRKGTAFSVGFVPAHPYIHRTGGSQQAEVNLLLVPGASPEVVTVPQVISKNFTSHVRSFQPQFVINGFRMHYTQRKLHRLWDDAVCVGTSSSYLQK